MLNVLTALTLVVLGGATVQPSPELNIQDPEPIETSCVVRQSLTQTPKPKPQVKAKKVIAKNIIAPGEVDNLINKYASEYGADPNLMKSIAKCESTFNANAVNGQHLGMYQYKASTWVSTRKQMGLDTNPDLRTNAEEAIKTTAFKISRGGQNAWKECL